MRDTLPAMARTKTKRAFTGVYGGMTAEQRKQDRRRRLMDAALEIIGTQGWSRTTITGVCEQARVGPRFFYEEFDDLDALAVAVLDEIVQNSLQKVLLAILAAPEDLPAKVRAAIEVFIGEVTDDPRRARFLFAEAHGSQPLMDRRFAAVRLIADVVVQQASALLDLPEDSQRFMHATALVLTGGIAEMVLTWLDGGVELTRSELIELCIQLLLTTGDNSTAILARLAEHAS